MFTIYEILFPIYFVSFNLLRNTVFKLCFQKTDEIYFILPTAKNEIDPIRLLFSAFSNPNLHVEENTSKITYRMCTLSYSISKHRTSHSLGNSSQKGSISQFATYISIWNLRNRKVLIHDWQIVRGFVTEREEKPNVTENKNFTSRFWDKLRERPKKSLKVNYIKGKDFGENSN